MSETTFDIHALADLIVDISVQSPHIGKSDLHIKIVACLQRTIDTRLVPANFINYNSKKKKEKWTRAIKHQEFEISFWKNMVKELSGYNIDMQPHYNRLNTLLILHGLRRPAKPGGNLTCFYCEREMDAAKFGGERGIFNTQDHVLPKSKFGKSDYTNLVNACNECNLLKGDLVIKQFIQKMQRMQDLSTAHPGIPMDRYPVIIKNAKQLLFI